MVRVMRDLGVPLDVVFPGAAPSKDPRRQGHHAEDRLTVGPGRKERTPARKEIRRIREGSIAKLESALIVEWELEMRLKRARDLLPEIPADIRIPYRPDPRRPVYWGEPLREGVAKFVRLEGYKLQNVVRRTAELGTDDWRQHVEEDMRQAFSRGDGRWADACPGMPPRPLLDRRPIPCPSGRFEVPAGRIPNLEAVTRWLVDWDEARRETREILREPSLNPNLGTGADVAAWAEVRRGEDVWDEQWSDDEQDETAAWVGAGEKDDDEQPEDPVDPHRSHWHDMAERDGGKDDPRRESRRELFRRSRPSGFLPARSCNCFFKPVVIRRHAWFATGKRVRVSRTVTTTLRKCPHGDVVVLELLIYTGKRVPSSPITLIDPLGVDSVARDVEAVRDPMRFHRSDEGRIVCIKCGTRVERRRIASLSVGYAPPSLFVCDGRILASPLVYEVGASSLLSDVGTLRKDIQRRRRRWELPAPELDAPDHWGAARALVAADVKPSGRLSGKWPTEAEHKRVGLFARPGTNMSVGWTSTSMPAGWLPPPDAHKTTERLFQGNGQPTKLKGGSGYKPDVTPEEMDQIAPGWRGRHLDQVGPGWWWSVVGETVFPPALVKPST
jgi:hypothetical protein